MKIVEILASPHGIKGNTSVLSSQILLAAERAGAAVTRLSLSDYEVKPCLGCDACHKTGRCPQRDDFDKVKQACRNADGIVLASPNYIFNVSAQMKAFLDRCCGLLHCQAWEGKYGLAVVTSGGGGCEEVERYLLRFMRAMGCWTVGSIGAEAFRLADESARDGCFEVARELGDRLAEAIRAKRTFPDQQAEKDAFHDRMMRLVRSRGDAWPFEYEHWQSRGWLDRSAGG